MRQIISIHTGQFGVQIGKICWKLYCRENGLRFDGYLYPDHSDIGDTNCDTFFSHTKSGKYVPRAIFADFDDDNIIDIQCSQIRQLFKDTPYQLLNGKDDTSNLYARGYYSVGKSMIESTLESIRKLAEQCTGIEGFSLYHSLGGGTGSGFTSLLLNELSNDYKNIPKFEFSIFPSEKFGTSVLEPYNAVLSTHSTIDKSDCSFLFDNLSISKICNEKAYYEFPTINNINGVLCKAFSTITTPFSLDNESKMSIFKLKKQLIPLPKLHYPICSFGPIKNIACSCTSSNEEIITDNVFDNSNFMFNCDPYNGNFLSLSCIYRGYVEPEYCYKSIDTKIKREKLKFIKNVKNDINVGINYKVSECFPELGIARYLQMVCLIANTTTISQSWQKLRHEFDLLYKKRAFVHWYINEGMEESEFKDARQSLSNLINEYKKVDNENNKK